MVGTWTPDPEPEPKRKRSKSWAASLWPHLKKLASKVWEKIRDTADALVDKLLSASPGQLAALAAALGAAAISVGAMVAAIQTVFENQERIEGLESEVSVLTDRVNVIDEKPDPATAVALLSDSVDEMQIQLDQIEADLEGVADAERVDALETQLLDLTDELLAVDAALDSALTADDVAPLVNQATNVSVAVTELSAGVSEAQETAVEASSSASEAADAATTAQETADAAEAAAEAAGETADEALDLASDGELIINPNDGAFVEVLEIPLDLNGGTYVFQYSVQTRSGCALDFDLNGEPAAPRSQDRRNHFVSFQRELAAGPHLFVVTSTGGEAQCSPENVSLAVDRIA